MGSESSGLNTVTKPIFDMHVDLTCGHCTKAMLMPTGCTMLMPTGCTMLMLTGCTMLMLTGCTMLMLTGCTMLMLTGCTMLMPTGCMMLMLTGCTMLMLTGCTMLMLTVVRCWCLLVVQCWCLLVVRCWCLLVVQCWCLLVVQCWCLLVVQCWCLLVVQCWCLLVDQSADKQTSCSRSFDFRHSCNVNKHQMSAFSKVSIIDAVTWPGLCYKTICITLCIWWSLQQYVVKHNCYPTWTFKQLSYALLFWVALMVLRQNTKIHVCHAHVTSGW